MAGQAGPSGLPPQDTADLRSALRRTHLDFSELWLRYFQLGGTTGPLEIDAHVQGLMPLERFQADMLKHALNERLAELGLQGRLVYTFPLPARDDGGG
jgi:hypothetical protein